MRISPRLFGNKLASLVYKIRGTFHPQEITSRLSLISSIIRMKVYEICRRMKCQSDETSTNRRQRCFRFQIKARAAAWTMVDNFLSFPMSDFRKLPRRDD